MKRILASLAVAALMVGAQPVFAADSSTRQVIDDQKQQAELEYEQKKAELKQQYTANELEQKLEAAKTEYENKVRLLDQQRKAADDPDVNRE